MGGPRTDSSTCMPYTGPLVPESYRPHHVFGEEFGNKHARLLWHSSYFDNRMLSIHQELFQAESFHWHVQAPDQRINIPTSHIISFLCWISDEPSSLTGTLPLWYANFLHVSRACFIIWLVDWFSTRLQLHRGLLLRVWDSPHKGGPNTWHHNFDPQQAWWPPALITSKA